MKKIKVLFMSFVLLVCVIGSRSSVNAAAYSTGRAIVPSYITSGAVSTYYYLSNITDSPIDVTITFYDADGTMVIDDNNPLTGRISNISPTLLNCCDQNVDSSLTFTLNAHCTGYFNLAYTSATNVGYGEIQWSQPGAVLHGLVSWGQVISFQSGSPMTRASITINGGLPF